MTAALATRSHSHSGYLRVDARQIAAESALKDCQGVSVACGTHIGHSGVRPCASSRRAWLAQRAVAGDGECMVYRRLL